MKGLNIMQWQYLVLRMNNDEMQTKLNEEGKVEWELVSCFLERPPEGYHMQFICVFKRPE